MKKQELQAKIDKAKKNTAMPEALKAKYIAKIEKEIADLEEPAPPKGESLNDKFAPKTKKLGFDPILVDLVGSKVYKNTGATGSYTISDIKIISDDNIKVEMTAETGGLKITQSFTRGELHSIGKGKEIKRIELLSSKNEKEFGKEFMESNDKGAKKTFKEKDDEPGVSVTITAKGKKYRVMDVKLQQPWANELFETKDEAKQFIKDNNLHLVGDKPSSVDYNCDELIEKEKARKASSKKSDKKPEVKKSETAIKSATEGIKNKYKEGDLTKDQILKLIQELRKDIKQLENLLKSAK